MKLDYHPFGSTFGQPDTGRSIRKALNTGQLTCNLCNFQKNISTCILISNNCFNAIIKQIEVMKSRELGPKHSTQSVARYASATYLVNSFRFFERRSVQWNLEISRNSQKNGKSQNHKNFEQSAKFKVSISI